MLESVNDGRSVAMGAEVLAVAGCSWAWSGINPAKRNASSVVKIRVSIARVDRLAARSRNALLARSFATLILSAMEGTELDAVVHAAKPVLIRFARLGGFRVGVVFL